MSAIATFTLSFEGGMADEALIDFYDAAEAIDGFQRTLALTTHLALNGEIITQAPSLKNARILVAPPEEGSWKITAMVLAGLYMAATAPRDTPLGHLVGSIYDYAVSQSLGFHVDYETSLWQQYLELKQNDPTLIPPLESKVDALIEKIEAPIKAIHRPLVASETASQVKIERKVGTSRLPLRTPLTPETYQYVSFTSRDERPRTIEGRVSSYNVNTFKGRIFDFALGRPVPFELADVARDLWSIGLITGSLNANALSRLRGEGDLQCRAFADESRTGIVKRYLITDVRRLGGA